MANSDLVRGSIDTIILSVLLEGDNYGYQIIKEIYLKSGRNLSWKEPTLSYRPAPPGSPGALESYWGRREPGGRRKYYRVTEAGKVLF